MRVMPDKDMYLDGIIDNTSKAVEVGRTLRGLLVSHLGLANFHISRRNYPSYVLVSLGGI